jgi:hypothetical protein
MRSKLTIIFILLALLLVLSNCATGSYGTTKFRNDVMESNNIAFSPNGLSKEQIDVILNTKFPPDKPISLSLFFLVQDLYYRPVKYDPTQTIIQKLDNTPYIKRIVPVPTIFLPTQLTIDSIQQIGIRSLSEYSIIFYGDSSLTFFSYKSPLGNYMVSSTLDFVIIDNRTTAIISSDKLFSEFQTPVEFLTDKEYQKTLIDMYNEQANILYDKINTLFNQK